MKRLLIALSCVAGILSAQSTQPSAMALPSGVTRGASVEGITEYQLANGLRVLLFPDPTKTSTTVNITYLVGSRNENYGETGMAHLLEHMLFKGSPKHTNIPQELTEHGARPNGTTSTDRTNYFETFASNDTNLNWSLDLESDRMVNSFVRKSDLDREMTVVRNEFEMGENSPIRILMERVQSTAYLWHNYGHSTIGARSDIENVPIERLQAFYHQYYQPDNAVLTIAGQMDEAKTLALVAKYFAPIPKPSRVIAKTYTAEPVQDGERTVTLRRVGDAEALIVAVHVPALASPDGVMGDLLGDVLADSPSGRLYKALVETRKCSFVAANATDNREPGLLMLLAQAPKTANLDEIRDIMSKVVDDAITHPPTDAEVERMKTKETSQFDMLLRNSDQLGLFLSEFIAAGDWRLAFIVRDQIAKATTEQVDQFARTYLKESNRTVGLFFPTDKPDRSDIPPVPDVAALVKNYKGGEAIAQGEVFDASPGNIDKRTIRGELQPGLKLAVISKKTRGAVVNATLRLHFGDEKTLKDQDIPGSLTADMLMRGSTVHNRQQISDMLDKLRAQMRITGTADGAIISVQTTKQNFPALMDLLAEIVRKPAFSADEFEQLRQQQITSLESELRDPQTVARDHMAQHLAPYPKGDIRYAMSADETIAALKSAKLSDVQNFYNRFYGASHAELVAVGEVDSESLQKQASTLFNGWSSKEAYQRVVSNYKSVPAVNRTFDTPDKANAIFLAALPVKMDDSAPDYPALLMANYMLGGGFLNSRLATRIRVKDGLSYGIGSQLSVPVKEDEARFMTYAISAPQNTAKVESDFKEELQKAIATGFTDPELSAAKAGWLQSRQVSLGNDSELTTRLASNAHWDRTMSFESDLQNKVKALTTTQVNAALKRYLNPDQISIFKAGDFSKPAQQSQPAAPTTGSGGQ